MTSLARSWALVCVLALAAGCGRAQCAAFVPRLELSFRASQGGRSALATELDADSSASDRERWHARAVVWLSFQPPSPASAAPTRFEISGLAASTPCAEDDVTCLQETAELEVELRSALEDLP